MSSRPIDNRTVPAPDADWRLLFIAQIATAQHLRRHHQRFGGTETGGHGKQLQRFRQSVGLPRRRAEIEAHHRTEIAHLRARQSVRGNVGKPG